MKKTTSALVLIFTLSSTYDSSLASSEMSEHRDDIRKSLVPAKSKEIIPVSDETTPSILQASPFLRSNERESEEKPKQQFPLVMKTGRQILENVEPTQPRRLSAATQAELLSRVAAMKEHALESKEETLPSFLKGALPASYEGVVPLEIIKGCNFKPNDGRLDRFLKFTHLGLEIMHADKPLSAKITNASLACPSFIIAGSQAIASWNDIVWYRNFISQLEREGSDDIFWYKELAAPKAAEAKDEISDYHEADLYASAGQLFFWGSHGFENPLIQIRYLDQGLNAFAHAKKALRDIKDIKERRNLRKKIEAEVFTAEIQKAVLKTAIRYSVENMHGNT